MLIGPMEQQAFSRSNSGSALKRATRATWGVAGRKVLAITMHLLLPGPN
jgi:hypothetical protein